MDPYGRAIQEFHRGEQTEPLIDRDGTGTREHAIEAYYFGEHEPEDWFEPRVDGALLDMGAGAGRDARYFQERVETVAIDPSEHLVETMRERGVDDARVGDMFSLRAQFDRDRFAAALAIGSQLQLAPSQHALRVFLGDLAYVTTDDATAMLDGYDPERAVDAGVFAVRDDPEPGWPTACSTSSTRATWGGRSSSDCSGLTGSKRRPSAPRGRSSTPSRGRTTTAATG